MKTEEKLKGIEEELNKVVLGREKTVRSLVLALASNEHILIIGKHGEAKTMLVQKLSEITKLKTYYRQLHNETTIKEIVGLLNPISYQNGKLELIKTDFWDSNILFFDEFLRARSEFNDLLLEVMVERKYSKSILGNVKIPVISVICTSNPLTEEYNTERLDLALKSRFSFILKFDHLIEERPELIKSILNSKENELKKFDLSAKELIEFRQKAIDTVKYDSNFIEELFTKVKDSGFPVDTRFIKKFKEICQTNALLNGRTICNEEDYLFCTTSMLNNRFDKLTYEKIDEILDDTVLLVGYKDLVIKIKKVKLIDNPNLFIEKSAEILEETKEDYPEYPTKLKKNIDTLREKLKTVIHENLDSVKPTVMQKLDTEEFKPIIIDFLDLKKAETKFVQINSAKHKVAKEILKKIKYCTVNTVKEQDYEKYLVKPNIEKIQSFKELERIKNDLEVKNLLSVF